MINWGWRPERTVGIWRHGAGWLRPFVASAPYLTILLLLLMFHLIGGTMTAAKGLLFELPSGSLSDGEVTDLVATVLPLRHEILVFFDDSRYVLGDAASVTAFGERLAERTARSESRTLLVMADRRVAAGELMQLADVAKRSGVEKVLFAEKRTEDGE